MKRIAVIFDLDETIGYFGDVAVFIEAYEKYRNKNGNISDEELFIIFNTIPDLFRKGIFDIFRLLRNFKKNNNDKKNKDDKLRVLIYTNNMGPKTWVYSIKRYIEEKIEYKLFDRVITAWKVDGVKYEEKRTSHDKKYEDLIKISEELKNYNKNLKIAQWFEDPLINSGPDYNENTKKVLDKLELTRYCCRRVMLGHTDLIDII